MQTDEGRRDRRAAQLLSDDNIPSTVTDSFADNVTDRKKHSQLERTGRGAPISCGMQFFSHLFRHQQERAMIDTYTKFNNVN